jgi:acetate kinase
MKILVVNAGSSSHKLSFYDVHNEEPTEPLWQGVLDWGKSDQEGISLKVRTQSGAQVDQTLKSRNIDEGLHTLLNSLWEGKTQVVEGPDVIEKIGHRVVHGGAQFEQPTLINEQVKEEIRKLIPLAPLHNLLYRKLRYSIQPFT